MESGENAGNATLQAHLQTRWGNASMLAAGQQCTMPFLNFLSAKASSSQDHHAAPSRPRSHGPFQRLPRHVDEQRPLSAGGHQQPGRSVIFPWQVHVCVSFGGDGTRRRSGRTARRRRGRGKRRRRRRGRRRRRRRRRLEEEEEIKRNLKERLRQKKEDAKAKEKIKMKLEEDRIARRLARGLPAEYTYVSARNIDAFHTIWCLLHLAPSTLVHDVCMPVHSD